MRALLSVLLILFSPAARAAPPSFSEASQRQIAVVLNDGLSVKESIPMYPVGTEWYVPIAELSQALGLSIDVAPNLGKAVGYVLDENRTYTLDLEDCTVEHDGQLEVFECDEAAQYENDIYVSLSLIQKTLPLKLSVNSYRSEATVTPRQKLPEQLRIDREKQVGRHKSGYPEADVPSLWLDGLTFDQQLGFLHESSPNFQQNTYRHDTVATGELIGMEASAFVGGTNRNIERQRYTLARKDPNGGVLGPLNAKDIQLVDVTIPSLPVIGGGGIYRGALVSSYNLQSLTQFGTRDFIGDIASGWEVELYQNDVLIDRRPSSNGRYEFRGIPLLYGANRFRLAFYGPQGQRRETYETYSIDSAFLQPNSQSYRFAFGDTQIMGGHWLAQYDRSLAQNLTLVSAVARTPEVKDIAAQPIVYTLLGARAFTKNVLYSTTASSTQKGGFAWENSVQGPILSAIVGATYTRLSKFTSEIYPIERDRHPGEVIRGNFAFNLAGVRLTFEGGRTYYEEGGSNFVYTQRTSTKIGLINLFHTLGYDQAAQNTTGELSALTQLVGYDFRAVLNYDKFRTNFFNFEARKNLSDTLSVTAGYGDVWTDSLKKLYASLNRQFENFTLSANAAYDTKSALSIGGILSYSVGREPREGDWSVGPKAQALNGAASIFVYLDANQNGVFDPGEKALPGVELRVNQANTGVETNDKGIGVLTNLTPYAPADVTVSLRTLDDPFQKPNPKGLRFIPRPGKFARLELPIIISTELTGFVRTRDSQGGLSGKTRRGIAVRFVSRENSLELETKTESDGYFLIDDLRAGKYRLELDQKQLKALKLKSDPAYYDVDITVDGLLDNVKDFVLEPLLPGGN